jgi:hypothetical protein
MKDNIEIIEVIRDGKLDELKTLPIKNFYPDGRHPMLVVVSLGVSLFFSIVPSD